MRHNEKISLLIVLAVTAITQGKMCKGPNEYFTECGPNCGGDGCTDVAYFAPCNQGCKAGCFCECGYFRNSRGICVPAEKCDSKITNVDYPKYCPGKQCCGDYEYFTQSNSCAEQCHVPGQPEYSCASVYQGCFCLPGWKRDPKSGECISVDECNNLNRPDIKCPANQTTQGCGNCESCEQGIKSSLGQPVACLMFCMGSDMCKCDVKNGFYRNFKENCVSLVDC